MSRQHSADHINPALMAVIGRPRTVLDVGCGAGVNGMVARRAGAEVIGIEADPEFAARAARVLTSVIAADPENDDATRAALGDRRFDLILMPDILERCAEPRRLVSRFTEYLAPEGRIVASAFNRSAWPVRLGLDSPRIGYATTTGTAPRMFSRRQAEELFRDAGLEVLSVELNPMLLKTLRGVLHHTVFLSTRPDEEHVTGFRDFSAYQMYLDAVRPFEVALTRLTPDLLTLHNVIVGRKQPRPGPLSLTVGMLTMDEEPSVARMIDEIRRHAPDAQILCVDSSVKDHTPVIAERMGARVLRQLPPRGHGPAMELLMYEAAHQSDALIYLDCDFTYPPAVIPEIRAILESGVDVVNAARIRTRPPAMPRANYLANKTFVWCAEVLNGIPVADLHSGMRGYRCAAIRAFSFDGEGDALPIDTLLWPARMGYHVVEIPIDYQERVGVSKLRKLAGTVWTFIRLGGTLRVGTRRNDTYDVWRSSRER